MKSKHCILSASIFVAGMNISSVQAQSNIEPPVKWIDENGVDLSRGLVIVKFPLISFGDNVRLSLDFNSKGIGSPDSFGRHFDPLHRGGQEADGSTDSNIAAITMPTGDGVFRTAQGEHINPNGSRYSKSIGGRFITRFFSGPSNTQYWGIFDESGNQWNYTEITQNTSIGKLIYSNGEILKYRFQYYGTVRRIRSIVSSSGYMIQFSYQRESSVSNASDPQQLSQWARPIKISGFSRANIYCDEESFNICLAGNASNNSVDIIYSNYYSVGTLGDTVAGTVDIQHSSGFRKVFSNSAASTKIYSPGADDEVELAYPYAYSNPQDLSVFTLKKGGRTWRYQYNVIENEQSLDWNITRTDPAGGVFSSRGVSILSAPELIQDENNRISWLGSSEDSGYDGIQYPEGNQQGITRDDRNNIISSYIISKDGLQTQINYTAVFPVHCENPKTCNKPQTTTDARGAVTTYTYDSAHGGMLTETIPVVGGIAPQKRYEYAQRYAWIKDAANTGYVQAATPIWVKTKERFCKAGAASGATCAGGAADEVVTEFDYGPNAGPNNLLLRGMAVTATNSAGTAETQRTCYSYDENGRKVSETSPLANLAVCP
jgi:YD repeat-containing protein